jgi:hypothetical protein
MQYLLLFHGSSGYTKAHVTCICTVHCLSTLTRVWMCFQVMWSSAWSMWLFISISGHRRSAVSGTLPSVWDVTLRFPALGRGLCTPIYEYFVVFLSLLQKLLSSISSSLLYNSCVEPFDCVQKHPYLNQNLSLSVLESVFNRHAEILGLWTPRRLRVLRHLVMYAQLEQIFSLRTKMWISRYEPSRKRQVTVRFTGYSRTVGSQDGTSLMSAFRRLELGVAPVSLENLWPVLYDISLTNHIKHRTAVPCIVCVDLTFNAE